MKKLLTCAAALSLAVLFAGPASANLVVNGDFETGDFTGWTATPAASGSLFGVTDSNPHGGTFSAFFGAAEPPDMDTISQDIPTTAGVSYHLEFWLSAGDLSDAGENRFQITFGGLTVVLSNFPGFPYGLNSITTVATGPTMTLSFSAYNTADFFYLDDVSVTAVGGVVPEPSTLTLAALGTLGAVAASVRRRKT